MYIILNFNEFVLGKLSYNEQKGVYCYTSNKKGEIEANKKYNLKLLYGMFDSKDKESKRVFEPFVELLDSTTRPDICKMGKINDEDNAFVRLYKLANNVNTKKSGFWLSCSTVTHD